MGGSTFSAKGVLSLAVPALGALVIEPLLLLIDSVMVGHLGTESLAALSLASVILTTAVGVFIFLAYSTTAITARALGAGKRHLGVRSGVQAMWFGAALGTVLAFTALAFADRLVAWMGASGQVADLAVTYLHSASFGLIGMLVILAATGTLRGLLDMKTPLYVLAGGAVLNVALNGVLIYWAGLGIQGAGIALALTQTVMAGALVWKVVRSARSHQVSLKPSLQGVLGTASEGLPLFIRTLSLRAALLATVVIATRAGTDALAGHQVVNSIWTLAAFILDALAIASQSLVGVALGSGQKDTLRRGVRTLTWWGLLSAALLGAVVALTSPWVPVLFGPSAQMHQVASAALLAAGLLMPISGVVFVLDGVLIGAAEGPYLARLGVVTLLLYLPGLWLLGNWISANEPLGVGAQKLALVWLWVLFAGWFMLLRALANLWRVFSSKFGQRQVAAL